MGSLRENCDYGSCYLRKFASFYTPIHKPLTITICAFGTVANSLNIIILSRRYMRTPTNILLSGLSLAQLLLVSNYTTLQLFELCRDKCCSGAVWSPTGAWYKYFNVNFNVVFHTIAFTHTVVLSAFRFASIRWPTKTRTVLRTQQPWKWSLLIFAAVPLLCAPVYVSAKVGQITSTGINQTCAEELYDLEWAGDPTMISAVFWLFGIVFKLIPCSLIAIFSGLLIKSIRDANIRKQNLLSPFNERNRRPHSASRGRATVVRSRTTRMLIAVALLCFVVECTHGVLNLLTAIYGTDFGIDVYNQLGDLFEMLTLLYSSINFVLYCAMSTDFLQAFANIFCPKSARVILLQKQTTRKKSIPTPVLQLTQNGFNRDTSLATNVGHLRPEGQHLLTPCGVDPELSGVSFGFPEDN